MSTSNIATLGLMSPIPVVCTTKERWGEMVMFTRQLSPHDSLSQQSLSFFMCFCPQKAFFAFFSSGLDRGQTHPPSYPSLRLRGDSFEEPRSHPSHTHNVCKCSPPFSCSCLLPVVPLSRVSSRLSTRDPRRTTHFRTNERRCGGRPYRRLQPPTPSLVSPGQTGT